MFVIHSLFLFVYATLDGHRVSFARRGVQNQLLRLPEVGK